MSQNLQKLAFFNEHVHVVFLFTLKNFFVTLKAKFFNKKNWSVVKITSTWPLDIGQSF